MKFEVVPIQTIEYLIRFTEEEKNEYIKWYEHLQRDHDFCEHGEPDSIFDKIYVLLKGENNSEI